MTYYFSPNLGYHGMTSHRGEFQTYALGFTKLQSWKYLLDHVRRNGYKIFGRRISDPDNTDENDENLWLDIATDFPKHRLLAIYERYEPAKNTD